MRFSEKVIRIYSTQRHGHIISKEAEIYLNKDVDYFGVAKSLIIEGKWTVVHIPSERTLISCFDKRRSAERFVQYLSESTDINCILLCTAEFKSVKKLLKEHIEMAYIKFRLEEGNR